MEAFTFYGSLTSQVVNWAKSFIYSGIEVLFASQRVLLGWSDIQYGALPFSYLGVPLFKGRPSIRHNRPVVNGILHQFDSWTGRLLSFPSRACLINYVTTSKFFYTSV